jgi:hypothetical protein
MRTAMLTTMLVVLLGSAVAAERITVFSFRSAGVDSGMGEMIAMLVRNRLSGFEELRLVEPPPGVEAYGLDAALAAASQLEASKAVTGSVALAGYKYLIDYQLVDVSSGKIVLSDRTSVGRPDELDLVADRIATSIRLKRPFGSTLVADNATGLERSRNTGLSAFYLMTGYAFTGTQPAGVMSPGHSLFTLEAGVSYETPGIIAQSVMGLRRGKYDFNELYFDLLFHKAFSPGDVTPFVGGGVGVHRLSYGNGAREDDGLALIASGGVILFRTQYFRIAGALKGEVVLTEDLGPVTCGSLTFGLTSPTVGPGGSLRLPEPCVYTTLGAFFLTGLIVALTT